MQYEDEQAVVKRLSRKGQMCAVVGHTWQCTLIVVDDVDQRQLRARHALQFLCDQALAGPDFKHLLTGCKVWRQLCGDERGAVHRYSAFTRAIWSCASRRQ